MSQDHRTRGVIFDLDGTLYTLRARKLRLTLALIRDLRLLRHLQSVRAGLRERAFPDRESFHEALFAELSTRAGTSPDKAAAWYRERFLAGFAGLLGKRARMRPGLIGLLEELRKKGVRLAVVSDYGFVAERLRALEIPLKLFDDLYSNEDYGALKPSPKPLFALAEKWGIEPQSVVVVGDRRDLDEASARAAGMGFLGITDRPGSSKPGFVSWQEATERLRACT